MGLRRLRPLDGESPDFGFTVRPLPTWMPDVTDAVQVAVGESSTCVLTRSGRVRCWGENGYGQLGDTTTESSATPTEVRFCAESSTPIFPAPPDGVPLIAAMQRQSCYGSCPVYSVRVYADGTVIYRGDWHVVVRGGRMAHLLATELKALRQAFQSADFLHLPYRCDGAATDSPTVFIFYREGDEARLLRDYHGCEGTSPRFGELEKAVDLIIGTQRWIGYVNHGPFDLGAAEGDLTVPGVPLEPDER